jgi:hypothetical protein
VAAVIAAALLIGGGIGGYFIGNANDHDRPGFGRVDHRPDGPGFRDRGLDRFPNGPDRPNR